MWQNWDEYSAKLERATATNTELLRETAKGTILDVGCGIGKHLGTLENVALKRFGIDAGLSGLRKGKIMFPHLQLICASAYHLPLKSEVFDTVIMIDVIEHLEKPTLALKGVRRVLKPRGSVFIQTPNYPVKRIYDFSHWVKRSREGLRDDPTHVSKFSCRKLISIVSQIGFDVKLVIARNVFLDKYFLVLRRLRNSILGRALGQKIVIVAEKGG